MVHPIARDAVGLRKNECHTSDSLLASPVPRNEMRLSNLGSTRAGRQHLAQPPRLRLGQMPTVESLGEAIPLRRWIPTLPQWPSRHGLTYAAATGDAASYFGFSLGVRPVLRSSHWTETRARRFGLRSPRCLGTLRECAKVTLLVRGEISPRELALFQLLINCRCWGLHHAQLNEQTFGRKRRKERRRCDARKPGCSVCASTH